MLLESGPLRETTESYVLDGSLPPLAIPTTLQASLVARLDRLGVGQRCGVDRRRPRTGVRPRADCRGVGHGSHDLDAALERLTASGLVSRRGTPPHAIYAFKHALVQDAAYATMLKSQRRELHASIAKVLVEQFPALAQNQPESRRSPFWRGRVCDEAIGYWRRAAQLASARSAMREAVSSFERALQLLEALPETRERQEQAIDLRCDLSNALFALGTFELRFLRAAASLAEALDDRRRLGQVCVYLCRNAFMAGLLREAREFGERAVVLAKSLDDVLLDVTGSLYFGASCFHLGDYARAEDLAPESPAVARRRSKAGAVWPRRISCGDRAGFLGLASRRSGKVRASDRLWRGRSPPRGLAQSPLQSGIRIVDARPRARHQGRSQQRCSPAPARAAQSVASGSSPSIHCITWEAWATPTRFWGELLMAFRCCRTRGRPLTAWNTDSPS